MAPPLFGFMARAPSNLFDPSSNMSLFHQLAQRPSRAPGGLSRSYLESLFATTPAKNPLISRLPAEIQEVIIELVFPEINRPSILALSPGSWKAHPALTPPPSGASPFMSLPTEMMRELLREILPHRDKAFHPLCDDKEPDVVTKQKRKDASRKVDKTVHTLPNLMTINSKLRDEIAEVIYGERTFVIHVHEGLKSGGVEILNARRQPLQYLDCIKSDKRFEKFVLDKDFGFSRMKKIVIQIYPTSEDQDRHLAINTYFMNLALCGLLERPTNEKERITSIKIEFVARQTPATNRVTRSSIMRHEKPWSDDRGPKSSSIYNVSDVELALRPFAMLTRCHTASIELPPYLASDAHLSTFVANLEQSMMSMVGTLRPSDYLERNVEVLRAEMEEHVRHLRWGAGDRTTVAKLTDMEMAEDEGSQEDSDTEDDEGVAFGTQPVSANTRNKKHLRSLSSANAWSTAPKRKKGVREDGDERKRQVNTDDVGKARNQFYGTAKEVRMEEERQVDMVIQLETWKPSDVDVEDTAEMRQPKRSTGRRTRFATKIDAITANGLDEVGDDWEFELVEKHYNGEIEADVLREMGIPVPNEDADEDGAGMSSGEANWNGMETTGTLDSPLDDSMTDIDYGTRNASPEATATTATFDHAYPMNPDLGTSTSTIPMNYFTAAMPSRAASNPIASHTNWTAVGRGRATSAFNFSYPGPTPSPTPTPNPLYQPFSAPAETPFGPPQPQYYAQTPRTAIQTQDSGIGMPPSDGEVESQGDDKGQGGYGRFDFDAYMKS